MAKNQKSTKSPLAMSLMMNTLEKLAQDDNDPALTSNIRKHRELLSQKSKLELCAISDRVVFVQGEAQITWRVRCPITY